MTTTITTNNNDVEYGATGTTVTATVTVTTMKGSDDFNTKTTTSSSSNMYTILKDSSTGSTNYQQILHDKIHSIPIVHSFLTIPATYEQLRIINVIGYTVSLLITYGMGIVGGIFYSNSTLYQIFDKYQSLITPTIYKYCTFFIIIIYLFQLVWILQQYYDSLFRDKSYYNIYNIQYKYIQICCYQCLFIICFVNEYITVSILFLSALLVSLWNIVLLNRNGANTDDIDEQYPAANEVRRSKNGKSIRYYIEELPFTIHFGFIYFLFIICINLWCISREGRTIDYSNNNNSGSFWGISRIEFEYGIAIISIIILAISNIIFLFNLEFITVPTVIIISIWSIYDSLKNNTSVSIISQYSTSEIKHITHLSISIASIQSFFILCRIIYSFTQKCTCDDEYYDNPTITTTNNKDGVYIPPSTPSKSNDPNSLSSSYVNVTIDNNDDDDGVVMTSTNSSTTKPTTTTTTTTTLQTTQPEAVFT